MGESCVSAVLFAFSLGSDSGEVGEWAADRASEASGTRFSIQVFFGTERVAERAGRESQGREIANGRGSS